MYWILVKLLNVTRWWWVCSSSLSVSRYLYMDILYGAPQSVRVTAQVISAPVLGQRISMSGMPVWISNCRWRSAKLLYHQTLSIRILNRNSRLLVYKKTIILILKSSTSNYVSLICETEGLVRNWHFWSVTKSEWDWKINFLTPVNGWIVITPYGSDRALSFFWPVQHPGKFYF